VAPRRETGTGDPEIAWRELAALIGAVLIGSKE
jgi:hypothetical protein